MRRISFLVLAGAFGALLIGWGLRCALQPPWALVLAAQADVPACGQVPADAQLIDVRTPAEFRLSHLPGSRHDPALQQLDRQRPVVLICAVGLRSARAVAQLQAAGYTACNLGGGLFAWAAAGGPLEDAQGRPTAALHPYSLRWQHLRPAPTSRCAPASARPAAPR